MTNEHPNSSILRVEEGGRLVALPLGAAVRGRLEFASGAARLTIAGDPDLDDLARARFEGPLPEVRFRDGSLVVRYPLVSTPLAWKRRRADVTLGGSIPWEIVIRRGAAHVGADLRQLELIALHVAGGASDVDVSLPAPTRAVEVRIGGGASRVGLVRPRGVPVRLQIGGGVSKLELDAEAFGAVGGRLHLQSDGYDEAASRYLVVVGGGARHLTVAAES